MMGGFGSTRWAWISTEDTVESSRSLDINRLNRAGCLQSGYRGGWEWTRDGERVASISFRRDGDRLVLSYRVRRNGEEWQDVEQRRRIVWMSCRFGGARPYFVCPGVVNGIACGRRVGKLYGAGTYFLCRHCYRLVYASQREDRYDRALRHANNIRMRLGGEPGMASVFPARPKGMHHRTYERLQSAVLNAEILAEERLAIVLARLQRYTSKHPLRMVLADRMRRDAKGHERKAMKAMPKRRPRSSRPMSPSTKVRQRLAAAASRSLLRQFAKCKANDKALTS